MVTVPDVMSGERLEQYIMAAAKATDYEDGFGVRGCDLSKGNWWVAYTRQSTKEQAENDRLAEYLLTCARIAKERNVVVPWEYIVYDSVTSEHLGRPGIKWLRTELIPQKLVAGVIIPTLGRLSCDDHHRLTFEKECTYYGTEFVYGDAPSGMDIGSMFARSGISMGNYIRVKTNRESALAGNIARVMAGKVPSGRPSYGYNYKYDDELDSRGRRRIRNAWWELDEIDNSELVWGSPAWVVRIIFIWVGYEYRTQYWVAAILNRLNKENSSLFKPLYGNQWAPKMIGEIVNRQCYTGKGIYNENKRVPNPNKPLEDLTDEIPRTILRPKPNAEWCYFDVPSLTTQELWDKANSTLRERGRGRGKQGRKVEALFRGRMICPLCGKPMAVKRKSSGTVYYHCRAHYCKWLPDPCSYNRFIPNTWDGEIWDNICAMLRDDQWVGQQLEVEIDNNRDLDRLIRLEEAKANKYGNKISRVEEGFDGGLYILNTAKEKKNKYQQVISQADAEIARLKSLSRGFTAKDVEVMRQELKSLRDRNLKNVTFEEKVDLVARLGIKIYPSEDLKSRRINCELNIKDVGKQVGVAKGVFGRPYRSRTCDTLIKSHGVLV